MNMYHIFFIYASVSEQPNEYLALKKLPNYHLDWWGHF